MRFTSSSQSGRARGARHRHNYQLTNRRGKGITNFIKHGFDWSPFPTTWFLAHQTFNNLHQKIITLPWTSPWACSIHFTGSLQKAHNFIPFAFLGSHRNVQLSIALFSCSFRQLSVSVAFSYHPIFSVQEFAIRTTRRWVYFPFCPNLHCNINII